MTFDEVYNTVSVGAVLAVSDASYPPPESARFRYACWRSHNFSGALLEKLPADANGPRRLVVADQAAPCAARAYVVREDAPHVFALVT